MTLKYEVDSVDDLDENISALYTPKEDGTGFILNVSGVTSKAKVDEFRTRNVELLKQMDQYKGVDVEKYHQLQMQQRALEDEELIKAGDVEKVIGRRVENLNSEHATEVDGLTSQLNVTNRRLESLLIDSAVRDAAIESDILPTAVSDVLLRAKSVFSIDKDGNATPKNAKGEVIFSKDGVTPISIQEWVGGLKKSAPHLFISSIGGGANGNQMLGGVDRANMSAMQKISAGLK